MQILRFDEPHVVVLRLSGTLDRFSCREVDLAVRAATLTIRGRRLQADIGDLLIGDDAGAEMIRNLPLQGVEFSVIPQPIATLLDIAAEEECNAGCNRLQRLFFRFAQMARSAPFAFRSRICDLLRSVLPPKFVAHYLRTSKLCDW